MTDQLVIPGLEASTWELLGREPNGDGTPSRTRRPPDGAVRLLRELEKRGLDEDALGHAAVLVLALDAQTLQDNHNQEDA